MNYSTYEVTDFATDDWFIRWVTQPDEATNQFWTTFLTDHPQQVATVRQAHQLVLQLERVQHQPNQPTEDATVRRMWSHIEQGIEAEVVVRPLYSRRSLWYAAASVVLLLSLGWWFTRPQPSPVAQLPAFMQAATDNPTLAATFKTVRGPQRVSLQDGSQVQLSANSALRFPITFDTNQREVYLIGEAFFEVARRPDQPFLVHTNQVVTKVLGTSFQVRAYQTDPTVSVDVRTGKVAVYLRNPVKNQPVTRTTVTLTPNQKAVYQLTGDRLTKSISDNPTPLSSAVSLSFDEAPVGTILAALEQRYGITIAYDRERLAECTLTTALDGLSLFDQLSLVCKAMNATYEQKDGQLLVKGGGCQ